MSNDKIISIYGLIDPRNGEIKYVGSSNNVLNRVYVGHIQFWKVNYKGQTIFTVNDNMSVPRERYEWFRELASLRLLPNVIIFEETSKCFRYERERYWIIEMIRQGYDLTNSLV